MISRSDWGTINFEAAKVDINSVLSIARDLSDLPLQHLTDADAQAITNYIPPLVTHFQTISDFSLEEGGDPDSAENKLCQQLHNTAEEFILVSTLWSRFWRISVEISRIISKS